MCPCPTEPMPPPVCGVRMASRGAHTMRDIRASRRCQSNYFGLWITISKFRSRYLEPELLLCRQCDACSVPIPLWKSVKKDVPKGHPSPPAPVGVIRSCSSQINPVQRHAWTESAIPTGQFKLERRRVTRKHGKSELRSRNGVYRSTKPLPMEVAIDHRLMNYFAPSLKYR